MPGDPLAGLTGTDFIPIVAASSPVGQMDPLARLLVSRVPGAGCRYCCEVGPGLPGFSRPGLFSQGGTCG